MATPTIPAHTFKPPGAQVLCVVKLKLPDGEFVAENYYEIQTLNYKKELVSGIEDTNRLILLQLINNGHIITIPYWAYKHFLFNRTGAYETYLSHYEDCIEEYDYSDDTIPDEPVIISTTVPAGTITKGMTFTIGTGGMRRDSKDKS